MVAALAEVAGFRGQRGHFGLMHVWEPSPEGVLFCGSWNEG